MFTAYQFFGGLADIFLSLMLWFISDEQKQPTIFIDDNKIYAITEVVKLKSSIINENCEVVE